MRGSYTLALPYLSTPRILAPKAQPRRAAGNKTRFAARPNADVVHQRRHSREREGREYRASRDATR